MSIYEETRASYPTRTKDLSSRANHTRFAAETKWCRLDNKAWRRILKEQIRNYLGVKGVSLALIVVETG
jgi:hypothetical protein